MTEDILAEMERHAEQERKSISRNDFGSSWSEGDIAGACMLIDDVVALVAEVRRHRAEITAASLREVSAIGEIQAAIEEEREACACLADSRAVDYEGYREEELFIGLARKIRDRVKP